MYRHNEQCRNPNGRGLYQQFHHTARFSSHILDSINNAGRATANDFAQMCDAKERDEWWLQVQADASLRGRIQEQARQEQVQSRLRSLTVSNARARERVRRDIITFQCQTI